MMLKGKLFYIRDCGNTRFFKKVWALVHIASLLGRLLVARGKESCD